jgi:Lon protease-like protein
MSELLPLFPLPTVVLFPGVFLPLHIFEPRYRDMVAEALATDRMIGMVLLRQGWEDNYEGRPPVFQVGCSGLITHCEKLPDGRYNIILRGLDRFRILEEDHGRTFRRALTQSMPEGDITELDRAELSRIRSQVEVLVAPSPHDESINRRVAEAMSDEDLINALAQYLDLEPIEKQALLEQSSPLLRGRALVELLEMKVLMARNPAGPPHRH